MFDFYDKNADDYLDFEELHDVEGHEYLRPVLETTSCHMHDFIILQDTDDDRRLSRLELNVAMGNATFPALMRFTFKPRFSAALQMFLSAEGCGCLAEGHGRFEIGLISCSSQR